jgi:hypothetical protein
MPQTNIRVLNQLLTKCPDFVQPSKSPYLSKLLKQSRLANPPENEKESIRWYYERGPRSDLIKPCRKPNRIGEAVWGHKSNRIGRPLEQTQTRSETPLVVAPNHPEPQWRKRSFNA